MYSTQLKTKYERIGTSNHGPLSPLCNGRHYSMTNDSLKARMDTLLYRELASFQRDMFLHPARTE